MLNNILLAQWMWSPLLFTCLGLLGGTVLTWLAYKPIRKWQLKKKRKKNRTQQFEKEAARITEQPKNREAQKRMQELLEQAVMLHNLKQKFMEDMTDDPKKIKAKLDKLIKEQNIWGQYKKAFTQIYPNFEEKLQQQYPSLTGVAVEICCGIRSGRTNAEMAMLMCKTEQAVNMGRHRLRQAMGIDKEVKLEELLAEI